MLYNACEKHEKQQRIFSMYRNQNLKNRAPMDATCLSVATCPKYKGDQYRLSNYNIHCKAEITQNKETDNK